jgi:hypothetical protein
MDDDRGISAVLVFTDKGKALFDTLDVHKRRLAYRHVVAKNPFLETSISPNMKHRERFERAYRRMDMSDAVRYAQKGPLPLRVARFVCGIPRRVAGKFLRIAARMTVA